MPDEPIIIEGVDGNRWAIFVPKCTQIMKSCDLEPLIADCKLRHAPVRCGPALSRETTFRSMNARGHVRAGEHDRDKDLVAAPIGIKLSNELSVRPQTVLLSLQ